LTEPSRTTSEGNRTGAWAASLSELVGSPRGYWLVAGTVLGILAIMTLQLRLLLDVESVLDVDVVNFGLSAFRFDPLQHQPHPPGYPGYVVLLKLVHLLAPGLDPIEVAKWSCRLVSVATVPAAFWACRVALGEDPVSVGQPSPGEADMGGLSPGGELVGRPPLFRPLLGAALGSVQPLLWYYGADGQSHGAEALATLLLFGAAVRLRTRGGPWAVIAFSFCLGLSGSLRPTVSLLCGPLLIYLLWGRGIGWWLGSLAAGAAGAVLWILPLIALSGGLELYRRASQALVSEVFLAQFSPFGGRATGQSILYQASMFLVAFALAIPAFFAWQRQEASPSRDRCGRVSPWRATWWRDSWRRASSRRPSWRSALLALVAANAVFYAATFVAEPGYLAAVAAASVLAAATWPRRPRHGLTLRAGAVLMSMPLFVLLGPASVRLPLVKQELGMPTLSRVMEVEQLHRAHERSVCRYAGPEGLLLLSDHPVLTHNRYLPLRCEGLVFGLHLYHPHFAPSLDVWTFYTADSLLSVPRRVPLEDGPPGRGRAPRAVARVLIGQDASDELRDFMVAHARCEPLTGLKGPDRWPDGPLVWPARCFPEIARGKHRIAVQDSLAPAPGQ
jgi:hypothetical protein